jgi:hypothetical protein
MANRRFVVNQLPSGDTLPSRPLLHLPWYKTASNAESKDADPKGPVYLSCVETQPLDDDS